MPSNQPSPSESRDEHLGHYKKSFLGNSIFIAIALVIIVTIVAMTGVYYEYW